MFVGSNLVLQWVPGSGKVVRGDTKMSPGVLQRGVFKLFYICELLLHFDSPWYFSGALTEPPKLINGHS